MDIIALILSAVSIIVAIVCGVIAYLQNIKINNINMKSKYYDQIFDTYLIEKIPQARKYIRFGNESLTDTEQLCEVLAGLLQSSLYFKYANLEFYKKLKDSIQEIENYVSECGNKKFEPEEQGDVFREIHNKLEGLYKLINDSYVGIKK